jgi:orotidine-5'-phosphate decarboxylase
MYMDDAIRATVEIMQAPAENIKIRSSYNLSAMDFTPKEIAEARALTGNMTFLVPGVGAQGGEVKNIISKGQNSEGLGLIMNSGRAIIFSKNPAEEARKLRDEINLYR